MSTSRLVLSLLMVTAVGAGASRAQETARESSTEKSFPVVVHYSYHGSDYTMSLTGLTVRKKFVFKVYGMAHYAQEPPRGKKDDVLKAMTLDGTAKQITMDFARDVDAAKIREAYADGFKENATADELKAIQPLVDQFTGYFTKDVKENEQFILRWLPGGVLIATIAGEEKPAIVSATLARVLWTIWFGTSSIVDRDELVGRLAD